MCGFVGFTHTPITQSPEITIQAMTDTIIHRGPDSEGYFSDDEISLGFRRLSIIDLSDEGSQPMTNETNNVILTFNGEIYNFQDLKEELIALGHFFHSHTDSEVIIHGYEAYGVHIINRLRGMFAFALWDQKEERLLLARDMFGIKPLYYTKHTTDGSLLFASEIKAFLKHPTFIKSLNADALKPYLTFQYPVLEESFFKGVFKLKPAHYIIYEKGHIIQEPYWHQDFNVETKDIATSIRQIQEVMNESVNYHKISDVKVGSFLSGGIDSSYITALLKPHKTFSVGFKDYEAMFDETNHAKDLSSILKIENFRHHISAESCFNHIHTIMYHMDEPQSNPSCIPLYFLAKLAKEHVTVVLSGEGADEIFGGYEWYQPSKKSALYSILPYPIRSVVSRLVKPLAGKGKIDFLIKGGQPLEERFIGQAKVYEEAEAIHILREPYRNGPSVSDITKPIYDRVSDQDDVTKMQYLDLNLWLPGDILLKADKMSMAHSIELRVPFLDKAVMALAASLPTDHRVDAKTNKKALRMAALEALPDAWAKRPKLGFPVPIRHWMREKPYYEVIKATFQSDAADRFFAADLLLGLLEQHYSGKANNARKIWTVYVFLVWYDVFF